MAIIQKTVTWVGDTPPQGTDRYTWVDVDSAVGNWINSVTEDPNTPDLWNFDVSNNTGNTTRSATFQLRHWRATEFPGDSNLTTSFTITQYSEPNA